MPFFRLRTHAETRWPLLHEPGHSRIWAAYQVLDRTQWLAPEEIERGQLAQFRTLLAHSAANIPYYRDAFASAGVGAEDIRSMADFRTLPVLTRRDCQDQHDRLHTASLPAGATPLPEDTTSGTSGIPIRVLKTNISNVWWLACFLRDLEWNGFDPTGTMAVARTSPSDASVRRQFWQGTRYKCWHQGLDPLIESSPVHLMDVSQDPVRQLEWLEQVNPDYFLSYSSNLELLAGYLRDRGQRLPRLRAIQAISETLTENAEARIAAGFGAPVKILYSCTEAGYLASSCPDGHGLHVHAENAIVEIVDDSGRPCEPGETGRVLLTTLHNFRGPFIRYDIGDYATAGPARCPCGRGLPLLKRVQGKQRPPLRLADGRFKHPSPLVDLVTDVGGHHQHQIIQKAIDHVIVRIVPSREWMPDFPDRVRQAVWTFFESPLRVDVEVRDRLELPPSGKLLSVICEVG